MDAASLCPKCGIELQAELGSRCPLCGTPLRVKELADASNAKTNPAIPAPETNPVAIIPADPSGWSIEAAPPPTPDALRPAPSSPFTPMPSLVVPPLVPPPPPPATLPPPPFAAGGVLRPAAAPLPGPPVLGGAQASDPDSAVTAVMAGPPMPAARPLIVEQGDDGDEDAVDASSLEVTRTAPGSPAPAAELRPRLASVPPAPAIADAADATPRARSGSLSPAPAVPETTTLSPSRVPLRGASGVADPPPSPSPLMAPATSATIPAARVPLKDPPSGAGKAISRPSPSPIARESAAPADSVARPSRLGYVVVFVVGAVAVAGAFYAGRVTASATGSFPLPPNSTPVRAASPEVTATPAETEEAAAPSPEETTAAPEP